MKKTIVTLAGIALVVGGMLSIGAQPAHAIKAFSDEFKTKYVKADSDDANDKSLVEAVEKAKCNVCHEGKSKKNRNAYGKALASILDRKADKEDIDKIKKALDTVAKKKANDSDASTFGELIAKGKLPAGDAE